MSHQIYVYKFLRYSILRHSGDGKQCLMVEEQHLTSNSD